MASEKEKTVTIAKSAVVCKGAVIKGNVTIGPNTVIHPSCSILALGGPIQIGSHNLIDEQVLICYPEDAPGAKTGHVMSIGNWNSFQVGCSVSSSSIENGNVVQQKAVLKPGTKLGSGCTIGAAVILAPEEELENGTMVYGPQHNHRVLADGEQRNTLELKSRLPLLRQVLPAAHKLVGAK